MVARTIERALFTMPTGNVDNDDYRLNGVKLGAVSELDPGTSGMYCFDAFASHRLGPLGTLARAHGCTTGAGGETDGFLFEDGTAGWAVSIPEWYALVNH